MFIKKQLLCTFSNDKDYKQVMEKLYTFYKIPNKKLFVFCNLNNQKEVFITYNIIKEKILKFPNTISIHRKKESNTLFSINALNILIREENGFLDKNFELDWEFYRNSLIITGDVSVRIISLQFFPIENIINNS